MTALAHIDERAHKIAHHMVQERVAPEHEAGEVPVLRDAKWIEAPYRTRCLALRRAEGAEVVLAKQMCGRRLHALDVQRTMRPAYITVKKRAGDAMRSKQMNIATGRGGKS